MGWTVGSQKIINETINETRWGEKEELSNLFFFFFGFAVYKGSHKSNLD